MGNSTLDNKGKLSQKALLTVETDKLCGCSCSLHGFLLWKIYNAKFGCFQAHSICTKPSEDREHIYPMLTGLLLLYVRSEQVCSIMRSKVRWAITHTNLIFLYSRLHVIPTNPIACFLCKAYLFQKFQQKIIHCVSKKRH